MMRCAILPVKRLADAKSRLAHALPAAERMALASTLLEHTLVTVTNCGGIDEVLVVSGDQAVAGIAQQFGAGFLAEEDGDSLNGALARAADTVRRRGADAILVLPVDLPLLTTADLEEILQAEPAPPFLVIVADRHGQGTNLLYFSPPEGFTFAFGTGSFGRHRSAAKAAGRRVTIRQSRNIALDVDTPDDLAIAHRMGKIHPGRKESG